MTGDQIFYITFDLGVIEDVVQIKRGIRLNLRFSRVLKGMRRKVEGILLNHFGNRIIADCELLVLYQLVLIFGELLAYLWKATLRVELIHHLELLLLNHVEYIFLQSDDLLDFD